MLTRRHTQQGLARVTLLFAALLLVLACLPTFAWAQDATTTVSRVRVFQEYKVSASGLKNTFEYQIVPLESDAPLPVDESGASFNTFTLTRDQDMWLEFPVEASPSPSAEAYSYHYTLQPVEEKLTDGLQYIDILSTNLEPGINVYYLELHVQLPSSEEASVLVTPLVHIEGWDGPKTSDPGWRVGYQKPSTPDDSDEQNRQSTPGSSSKQSTPSNSANPSATGSSSTRGGVTSTSSSSPLAKTGDILGPPLVAIGLACVGMMLLAHTHKRRKEAGDGDA